MGREGIYGDFITAVDKLKLTSAPKQGAIIIPSKPRTHQLALTLAKEGINIYYKWDRKEWQKVHFFNPYLIPTMDYDTYHRAGGKTSLKPKSVFQLRTPQSPATSQQSERAETGLPAAIETPGTSQYGDPYSSWGLMDTSDFNWSAGMGSHKGWASGCTTGWGKVIEQASLVKQQQPQEECRVKKKTPKYLKGPAPLGSMQKRPKSWWVINGEGKKHWSNPMEGKRLLNKGLRHETINDPKGNMMTIWEDEPIGSDSDKYMQESDVKMRALENPAVEQQRTMGNSGEVEPPRDPGNNLENCSIQPPQREEEEKLNWGDEYDEENKIRKDTQEELVEIVVYIQASEDTSFKHPPHSNKSKGR